MPPYMYSDKQPCGTAPAYRRHIYHREKPCRECSEANARRTAEYRAKRRRATPPPPAAPAQPQGPTWWCVIAAADHLEWDGQPPGEVRREMADAAGLDPWAGAA